MDASKYAILIACFVIAACTTPMSQAMKDIKFVENDPPQDGWDIGTIVAIKRNALGEVSDIEALCTPTLMAPNLLKQNVNYRVHQTTESDTLQNLSASGKLVVDPKKIGQINAQLSAKGQRVKSIHYKISNASIVDTDAGTLSGIRQTLIAANQGCRDAIADRTSRGLEINVVEKLFVASVVYSVDTDTGAELSIDAEVDSFLKATLGAQFDNATKTLSTGNQLVYGMKFPL